MRLLLCLALCWSCDDDAAPAEPSEPTEARAEPESRQPPEAEPEQPAALRTDIGWSTPPPLASAEARAQNRSALRDHAAGRYEESLRGFRAALELENTYTNARFNAACALAKLGRLDAAAAEIETLLALDLPTFGPRYAADDDLADLRTSPAGARIDAFRELMIRSYIATMESGPVVGQTRTEVFELSDEHAEDAIERRLWMQVGVWTRTTRRFVPMGPLLSVNVPRDLNPVTSERLDLANRRVYVGTAFDWNSDMGYIADLHLRAFSVPDGRELGSVRPDVGEDYPTDFFIAHDGRGVRWSAGDHGGYVLRERGSSPPAPPAYDFRVDDERMVLTIGEGEDARIVRLRHPRERDMSTVSQALPLGADAIVVLTTNSVGTLDGTMTGAWALSRIDRATGEVERLERGREGWPSLTLASDGSIYFGHTGRVRSIPESGEPDVLPEGLSL